MTQPNDHDYEFELERARDEAAAWGDSFDEDDFRANYYGRSSDWDY